MQPTMVLLFFTAGFCLVASQNIVSHCYHKRCQMDVMNPDSLHSLDLMGRFYCSCAGRAGFE